MSIDLFDDNKTQKKKAFNGGRIIKWKPEDDPYRMKKSELRTRAQKIVQDGAMYSNVKAVVGVLATCNVMTSSQIRRLTGIASEYTLIRYCHSGILNRLNVGSQELKDLGMPQDVDKHKRNLNRLNVLTPLGVEVARNYDYDIPPTYEGYRVGMMLHDVLCNEAIVRLAMVARGSNMRVVLMKRTESNLYDPKGTMVLSPDMVMGFSHRHEEDDVHGKPMNVIIEFHNEDSGVRAAEKVEKYERIARDAIAPWRDQWGTDVFPPVIAVFRAEAVGKGYAQAVSERKSRMSLAVQYYGMSWKELVAGSTDYGTLFHFNTGKKDNLFPWTEGRTYNDLVALADEDIDENRDFLPHAVSEEDFAREEE
jgi:hypothetical protein